MGPIGMAGVQAGTKIVDSLIEQGAKSLDEALWGDYYRDKEVEQSQKLLDQQTTAQSKLMKQSKDQQLAMWNATNYEVRGDNINQYGDIAGDIDNEVAAKAIRYWSEGIRHKHGKQPRRWRVTERGGNETERVHIHGVIFTDLDNDTILKSWKFGIADNGRSTGRQGWVNEQTIN